MQIMVINRSSARMIMNCEHHNQNVYRRLKKPLQTIIPMVPLFLVHTIISIMMILLQKKGSAMKD